MDLNNMQIVHSPRARHLRISIDHEKNVSLVIPRRSTVEQGLKFLNSKKDWVEKTLSRIKPRPKQLWHYDFKDSAQIYFFGLPHQIQFSSGSMYPYVKQNQKSKIPTSLKLRGTSKTQSKQQQTVIPAPFGPELMAEGKAGIQSFIFRENQSIDKINNDSYQIITPGKKHVFENFLNNKLREHIYAFAYGFAKNNGFKFKNLTIKKIKSRWGSCSRQGNINFSLRLVHYQQEVINYVVIHELCHTREMNHSHKFWALVAQFCPDYKKCIKMLK